MPRTRAGRKKTANPAIENFLPEFLKYMEKNRRELQAQFDSYHSKLKASLLKSKLTIPATILCKTLQELENLPINWTGSTTIQILDETQTTTVKKKKTKPRSSSVGDDEGYRTAENSNGALGTRKARSRSRAPKTSTRTSRSASTRFSRTVDKFKTPSHSTLSNGFGSITPKMKPNMPHVILRRAKMGELAISMQGSPLLTGNVLADDTANINIPLVDGRCFSIQPMRGLRMSQLPQFDDDTKKQLETLRENLNKICSIRR